MCGFCGFANTENNQTDGREEILLAMMNRIKHRGPDSAGTYLGERMSLGFRRLSIIGLEDGSQPMFNEDKSLALVFNGEIYNYRELRECLIQKGHVFSSHADSETVLHLYEEHGASLLNHLRGMFAFAVYDIKNDSLFCARDPFGIKPFYYAVAPDGVFLFGSEIKCFMSHTSFVPELNGEALEQYLSFQYSVLPETFFKGVFKLPPAHSLKYENGRVTVARYFNPVFTPCDGTTLEKAVDSVDNAVTDSVKKHMVSDVEVGSFLSSGVDSSYVAACFGGAKTFTVGFDYEKYNEIEYAKELSARIGAEHHAKTITTEEYWDVLPTVQYHMDEPLADPAAVALYFVSREASKHVKVALSGEGADEFFGGYNIYREPMDLKILTRLPVFIRKSLAFLASKLPFNVKGKNFFIRGGKDLQERFIGNAFIFSKSERESILRKPLNAPSPMDVTRPYYAQVKHEDDVTKMQFLDIHLWLVGDILLKADKMSMAHSLEVRVPFLDREVFRAASRIPTRFRVNKKGTKFAFRQAAARHLPPDTAKRRKLGFPVPIRIWLKEEKYYSKVEKYFIGETAEKYFRTNRLLALLKNHREGKQDNSRKIWTVFMFLLWHEQFFESEGSASHAV